MEFTLSWLKKFLKTDSTLEQIVAKLNEIGLEVDEVIDRSRNLKEFIIAEITSIKPHPTASKLNICEVFNGSQTLQIVCGASNARKDLKVVLAPIGSLIPANNLKIKLSKIRDVESQGMLCSAAELLLEAQSTGIIELDSNAPVGEKFATYMNMEDPIIKVEITPNRGDCLGVYGIARDLAATSIGELIPVNHNLPIIKASRDFEIKIDSGCDIYFATIIENIQNNQTPKWLSDYLQSIGVRSISAIVDITNYIMYSFGQPLHAYDLTKIQGNIAVRKAKLGEKFVSLEDKEYNLTQDDLVICDEKKVIALAGIIGSQQSSCDQNTNSIILEAANFDNNLITLPGRSHSIDTKAKYRYERKIDKAFIEKANNLAIQLVLEICGGNIVKTAHISAPYSPQIIECEFDDLQNIGGIDIEKSLYETILTRLGFKFQEIRSNLYSLEVPSWRNDISIKEDIIEEILRIYGYNNIPYSNFIEKSLSNPANIFNPIDKVKITAAELGYHEVISWSFLDKKIANKFSDINDNLELSNPINSELNYMRPSIIPNLLEIIRKNQARGIEDLNLFEVGPIFSKSFTNFEQSSIAAVLTGSNTQNNIHRNKKEYDVYDIKFLVEELLSLYGYQLANLITSYEVPQYYHPTRSLVFYLDKKPVGMFGEINPHILRNFSIKKKVFATEIFIDRISHKPKKNKVNFSNYQAVERDFAFIVSREKEAGSLLKAINRADPLIKNAEIFDVYMDETLGNDKKSVAIKVTLLPDSKTLTDNEIKEVSDKIIEKAQTMGAELRG